MDLSEALGQVIMNRPILGYGAAFLGGVVATAGPCSLASIPLIIGFVGGYAEGSKKQAFIYSVTFVVGLAIGMSALGAAAALMGTMFGQVGFQGKLWWRPFSWPWACNCRGLLISSWAVYRRNSYRNAPAWWAL
jgi:hypothetical protein